MQNGRKSGIFCQTGVFSGQKVDRNRSFQLPVREQVEVLND
jgi:hypothetical protein